MHARRLGLKLLAAHLLLGGWALASAQPAAGDWAGHGRYRAANASLPAPASGERRVVFMGDSITEFWSPALAQAFPGKPYVNRGISAQTTPQMLLRFRQDVIELQPAAVVILAGTNDIAGNSGPSSVEMIAGHVRSMTQLARAHGIRVVLCAVLPAAAYYWNPAVQPAATIVALNQRLRELAREGGHRWVDYHAALADERGGLPLKYSEDGVHPNAAGYRVMAPLLEREIEAALKP
ncbi:SGNH/GDSL hydrolase family protein [Paucibacter sediminis]|uniref:SGNH/GDSL hydrolase family protein n=1 Tax=Paucibacter sediminis TaxID=3019553 RepID=A0AA95NFB4_9BURK|nr:SGNH/GDSL hydrolase family protein [Paucibacter sp. S2-9]WIT11249.1 SGNH/GDSL hydrolase family protein [Paucibacter sp. S2-9]